MSPEAQSSSCFLPYGRQVIDDDDVAAVAAVLRGNFLTTGPAVADFEAALGAVTGARHVAVCSSGTAALHLAALALGLGAGDKVVVPAVTFLATANSAVYVGAEVVFADVDPDTGLMEADHLDAAIAAADGPVKAVFPVHLAGQCADMAAIRARASDAGAWVVEDACHALGGTYRGEPIGTCSHSDLATFSFHPVKTVACGEGGAVSTRDPALLERIYRFRNHGMEREPSRLQNKALAEHAGSTNSWYYEMVEPGFNYRMSDIHAALGMSQLAKLDRFVTRRRELVDRYDAALTPLAPTVKPMPRAAPNETAWHLMVALIDFEAAGVDRGTVMKRLRDRGIGSQVHYIPVPWQPFFREHIGDREFPGAAEYYRRCLSLPLSPAMADSDVNRVLGELGAAMGA